MHYYLYKTTNQVNGKIYVGVHRTNDPDDGYLGSGTLLRQAIRKYGRENFIKEILEYFVSIYEMFERESEVVSLDFVLREDTYNIRVGGSGGWRHILTKGFARNPQLARAGRNIANQKLFEKYGEDWRSIISKLGKEPARLALENYTPEQKEQARLRAAGATQAALAARARAKRLATFQANKHQQGSKNSQFGKVWLYSSFETRNISVPADMVDQYLCDGWAKGRKMRF